MGISAHGDRASHPHPHPLSGYRHPQPSPAHPQIAGTSGCTRLRTRALKPPASTSGVQRDRASPHEELAVRQQRRSKFSRSMSGAPYSPTSDDSSERGREDTPTIEQSPPPSPGASERPWSGPGTAIARLPARQRTHARTSMPDGHDEIEAALMHPAELPQDPPHDSQAINRGAAMGAAANDHSSSAEHRSLEDRQHMARPLANDAPAHASRDRSGSIRPWQRASSSPVSPTPSLGSFAAQVAARAASRPASNAAAKLPLEAPQVAAPAASHPAATRPFTISPPISPSQPQAIQPTVRSSWGSIASEVASQAASRNARVAEESAPISPSRPQAIQPTVQSSWGSIASEVASRAASRNARVAEEARRSEEPTRPPVPGKPGRPSAEDAASRGMSVNVPDEMPELQAVPALTAGQVQAPSRSKLSGMQGMVHEPVASGQRSPHFVKHGMSTSHEAHLQPGIALITAEGTVTSKNRGPAAGAAHVSPRSSASDIPSRHGGRRKEGVSSPDWELSSQSRTRSSSHTGARSPTHTRCADPAQRSPDAPVSSGTASSPQSRPWPDALRSMQPHQAQASAKYEPAVPHASSSMRDSDQRTSEMQHGSTALGLPQQRPPQDLAVSPKRSPAQGDGSSRRLLDLIVQNSATSQQMFGSRITHEEVPSGNPAAASNWYAAVPQSSTQSVTGRSHSPDHSAFQWAGGRLDYDRVPGALGELACPPALMPV